MRTAYRVIALACLLGLLAGCANTVSQQADKAQLALIEQLLQRYPSTPQIVEGQRFIELNDKIRRHVDTHVDRDAHIQTRLKQVFRATKSPALSIDYDAGAHLNAAQVFEQGRANCLAFSALVVAMGRYSELPVSFQEVELPPSWSLGNDELLMRFRHVNVVVPTGKGRENVIDLRIDRFSHFYPRQKITDRQALALHFNNLAIEAMLADRGEQVLAYLNAALQADPVSATVWGNLGLALRRRGELAMAEAAYLKALSFRPKDYGVMNNLARVYHSTGRGPLAEQYRQRSARHRRNNPYYHFANARRDYRQQDYQRALENIEQAIKRKPEEGNFIQLKAYIYWHSDKREQALALMRLAHEAEQNQRTRKAIALQLQQWRKAIEQPARQLLQE